MRFRCGIAVLVIAAVAVLAAEGWGSEAIDELLIEKALDEPARISFADVTLEEAFKRLSQGVGVPLAVDEGAIGQLPHGPLTTINAEISGIAWRDALRELLKPLALYFEVGEDRIYIVGSKELNRQPQRLNRQELEVLVKLQSVYLNDREENLLKQLRQETGIDFGLVVRGQRREKANEDFAEKILMKTRQGANQVLDLYSVREVPGDGTWYIRAQSQEGRAEGVDIVILRKIELVGLKLDRRIDVEYKSWPIQKILQELARRANIELELEPGGIGLLDEHTRENYSLSMRSGTVKSALEELSGITGLSYEVTEEGVRIGASESLKALAAARGSEPSKARSSMAYVLTVTMPGTDLETMIFVREEDLAQRGLLEKWQAVREDRLEGFMKYLAEYPVSVEGK